MKGKPEPRSVGEALPLEMARVRDVVMPAYREIGTSGALGLALMAASLDKAAAALAEGDVVKIVMAYQDLKEWQL